MKTLAEEVKVIPNRTMEIANLYHRQSLALINLALTQNKLAIETSHQRASELLQIKEPNNVHKLVSSHMVNQVKEYLDFAVCAYQMGFDAQVQVMNVFQNQIEDNRTLTNDILKSHALSGNPLTTVAIAVVKNALNSSHAFLNSAKTMALETCIKKGEAISPMPQPR
jgi:hypothetical protein